MIKFTLVQLSECIDFPAVFVNFGTWNINYYLLLMFYIILYQLSNIKNHLYYRLTFIVYACTVFDCTYATVMPYFNLIIYHIKM